MKRSTKPLFALACLGATTMAAHAADVDSARFGWFSGDWRLTLGAAGFITPEYEGDDELVFRVTPLISFGKARPEARFTSRNDNISIGVLDSGPFRAGVVGRIVFPRDADDSDDLQGLEEVGWGGEVGVFAEYYPLDWLRVRGELRQGFAAHEGLVGDLTADAFYDVTETVRISGGPRLAFASARYFDAYYGISAEESAASGLPQYDPGSGIDFAGVGGAVTWKVTDRVTSSVFGEYARLMGPAADSPLVSERGSRDQFTLGLSTTYRFDFAIP